MRRRTPSAAQPPAWDGLSLRLADDRLVLGPVGARLVAQLIDSYAAAHRYATLPPHIQRLHADAAAVAEHVSGPADVRKPVAPPACATDEIGTKEAAELMGCTDKHVRRLAADGRLGRTRVAAGRRLVSNAEVLAYIAERRSA